VRQASGAAIASWGIHVPGADLSDLVKGADGTACPAELASELLGRKGLLAKEPATRLALCAVHQALGLPPRAPRPVGAADARIAVVASSNLGNVATVADIARTVRAGRGREVSPLAAPNASSNIVASSVAIWFRCGGPNFMVCSGATSGLDAVTLGCRLLRAGRADQVIVVGAEPDDPTATALYPALTACAACVVLKPAGLDGGVPVITSAGVFDKDKRKAGHGSVFIGPGELAPRGEPVIDLERRGIGGYGALGVLQVAVAAAMGTDATVVCGDDADGWRIAVIRAGQLPPGGPRQRSTS
jgi:3-oxoacyl-[acyl-carrier-protein] synthase II